MSDTVPTPPEREGEERWTLWRCPTCEQGEVAPEAVDRDGEPVCEWHTQEGTRRLEPVELVPLARLAEVERKLEEERAAVGVREHERDMHQERSAVAKLAALRERLDSEAGLEDRLWSALESSVSLLERHLTLAGSTGSRFENDQVALRVHGANIRHLTETLDRLGLLKPPPLPVEAPGHDGAEVWVAAKEIGADAPPDEIAALAIGELRKAQAENADLRSKLQTLERQRDEARVELRRVILTEPANAEEALHDWKRVTKDRRGFSLAPYWRCGRCGAQENGWIEQPKLLGCSANAEGIASEGGSAEQAANPREAGSDAPSAEAGHLPAPREPSIEDLDDPDWASAERAAKDYGEPSPTGGGAEDLEARGYDDGYRHGRSDEAHAARKRAPDWQALAGELAGALTGRIKRHLWDWQAVRATDEEAAACLPALARYHEAIAQHSGEER